MSDPLAIEITRKGTHPIFKYTVRKPGQWRTCIMIDDDYGDITVTVDGGTFAHWWGISGRVNPSLRAFLCRVGTGYLEDKFSYGLSRYDSNDLERRWEEDLKEAVTERTITEDESKAIRTDLVERISDCRTSGDYYALLNHEVEQETIELIERIYGGLYESPTSDSYANPKVKWFIREQWPHIVAHLKKELAEEQGEQQSVD